MKLTSWLTFRLPNVPRYSIQLPMNFSMREPEVEDIPSYYLTSWELGYNVPVYHFPVTKIFWYLERARDEMELFEFEIKF